jgi:hypothetical protein
VPSPVYTKNMQKKEEATPYMAKIKLWERVTGEKGVVVPP